MVESSRRPKRLILSQVLYLLELGELLRRIFDKVSEDVFVVVADENDFLNSWNFRDRAKAVPYDWVSGDIEERLRPNLSNLTADGIGGEMKLTLGTSRDRGLKRVPLEGPPTYFKVKTLLLRWYFTARNRPCCE